MDLLQDILAGIANNIFNQVPLLIGLIALVGLLLQRKPVETVVGGTLRAVVGVVILTLGVDIFVGGLVAFQAIVSSAVGLEAPTASSTLNDFLAGSGSSVPMIIAVGFAIHLLLVAVFRSARYVYLTGHLMFWMSIVIAASFVEVFADISTTTLIFAGAVIIACYWTLQPLVTAPLMKRVTGHDQFGLGHTTSSVALLAGYGSKALRLGDAEKHDTEKLKLPRQISFLKDINVSTALIISVIMLVAIGFAENAVVSEQMADSDLLPWAWGLTQALRFAAGIAILLFGVRMFLAEIVPAFKGISDKLLPGTKPALDIPVVFPKAPTAVMLGFLSSTVVFLILMGVFAATGWFVLVPPMIMLFFGGGSGGVFGNAVAGWRGAVFGGAVNGALLAVGQWIGWGLYGDTAPEIATLADPDWYAVGWLLLGAAELLSPLGPAAAWVVAGAVLVLTAVILLLLGRRAARRAALAGRDDDAATAGGTSPGSVRDDDATTAGGTSAGSPAGGDPATAGGTDPGDTASTSAGTSGTPTTPGGHRE